MQVIRYNVSMNASKAVKVKKAVSKIENAFNAGMLTDTEARDILRSELSGLFEEAKAARVFLNCGASFLSGVKRYKNDYRIPGAPLVVSEVL